MVAIRERLRVRTLLTSERSFWAIASVLLTCLSAMKGFVPPSPYAATLSMFNYDFGLIKRGLFGATVGHLFHLEHFQRFTVVSYGFLGLLILLLLWFARESGVWGREDGGIPVALFCSSMGASLIFHFVGLLEVPLACGTVALLCVRSTRCRFPISLLFCAIAPFLHEMFLLVFLPVLIFSFVIDGYLARESATRLLWKCGSIALVCLTATLRLSLHGSVNKRNAGIIEMAMRRKADFPVDHQVLFILQYGIRDNMRLVRSLGLHNVSWMFSAFIGLLLMGSVFLMILFWIRCAISTQMKPGTTRGALGLMALVGTCPLLMGFFALDIFRWEELALFNMFLVFLLVCRALGAQNKTQPVTAAYRNLAILVIAVGMASGFRQQGYLYFNLSGWPRGPVCAPTQ